MSTEIPVWGNTPPVSAIPKSNQIFSIFYHKHDSSPYSLMTTPRDYEEDIDEPSDKTQH